MPSTVYPWIANDNSTLRQLQFCNLGFHFLVFKCYLLNHDDFFPVSGAMLIWAESNMIFNSLLRKIDHRLMEFVLRSPLKSYPYARII